MDILVHLGPGSGNLLENLLDKRFCTKSTIFSAGSIPRTTIYTCACRDGDMCNFAELLRWGETRFADLPTVSCSMGGSGAEQGNYCRWVKSLVNHNQSIETFEAVTSSLEPPSMGCTKTYGYATGAWSTVSVLSSEFMSAGCA